MTYAKLYDHYWMIRKDKTLSPEEKREKYLELSDVPVLARDNHGYEYPVVFSSRESQGKWEPVLNIVATPGSWYLHTLLRDPSSEVYIDYGQTWVWVNALDVLDAICNPDLGLEGGDR